MGQVKCWVGFRSQLGEGEVAGNSGLTAAEQMSPSFTHPGNYLMWARHWSGDGAGNQVAWLRLHGADSLGREGDLEQVSTGCAKCSSSIGHRCSVPSDWVSLSPPPPLPCPPVYVMERERKTDDTGCQAALAACWAALCCCCLLDNLD